MRSTLDLKPRPRSARPLLRALRSLWTLPTNLFGHAIGAAVSRSVGRPVGSDVARGRLYIIRVPLLDKVQGITLGHAILLSPDLAAAPNARAILAHELAHTRQHDVLGPLYLPTHAIAQLVSAMIWVVRPRPESDPVHAYNPLEQRWLFLGHAATLELEQRMTHDERERWLVELGCPERLGA